MGWDDIFSGDSGLWPMLGNMGSAWMTYSAANKAAEQQANALNQSNAYLQQVNAPMLAMRNAAVGRMMGGFGFTPQGTARPVNWSAAYQQDTVPAMINPGEARVLKNLGGAGVQNPQTGFWHFFNQDGDTAQSLRTIGAKNSYGGQDTILAHITPWEAAALKHMGGSGRLDPVTGLPHFDAGGRRGDADSIDTGKSWDGADDSDGNTSGGDDYTPDSWSRHYTKMGEEALAPESTSYGGASWGREKWNNPENPDYLRGPGTYDNPSYYGTPKTAYGPINGVLGGIGLVTGNPAFLSAAAKPYTTTPKYTANGYGINPATHEALGNSGGDARGYESGWGSGSYSQNPVDSMGGYSNTNNVLGDFERDFGPADLYSDPSYQWRFSEGIRGLDRSAAARGTLFSGQYIKDLSNYVQGQASQEYADAWNRYQTNRGNKFNMLASMAGLGQTATGQTANSMSNNLTGLGNVYSAGTIAGTNAWTNALNNTMNNYGLYSLLSSGNNSSGWNGGGIPSTDYSSLASLRSQGLL